MEAYFYVRLIPQPACGRQGFLCLVSHLRFSSMPQPLRVFSLPWQIPAMGEDPEGVCIDFGSDLETPLAVPMLRAHDEHRIT